MSDADSIEAASRRLAQSLDALEAAGERRHEAHRNAGEFAAQIHALDADRARLASELDRAMARIRALESANREATQRIAQAIETIRELLASV